MRMVEMHFKMTHTMQQKRGLVNRMQYGLHQPWTALAEDGLHALKPF